MCLECFPNKRLSERVRSIELSVNPEDFDSSPCVALPHKVIRDVGSFLLAWGSRVLGRNQRSHVVPDEPSWGLAWNSQSPQHAPNVNCLLSGHFRGTKLRSIGAN